jgi:hypothetical protein
MNRSTDISGLVKSMKTRFVVRESHKGEKENFNKKI